MEVLKVSAKSQPKAVAGTIAAVLREKGAVEVQAVGAGAVSADSSASRTNARRFNQGPAELV